jgi:protein-S-isoprenylcysteine O-methyltransferase Ste14
MAEIILGVGILLVVGGLVLLVWSVRQLREISLKPRYRRNGGKF